MAVTDTNYAALHNATALASQGYGLSDKGMYQADLIAELSEFETNFNAVLTKLDADGGVTDTDYNATYAVDLNDTVVGSNGLSQDNIVSFLDSFITNFNATLTKLDSDSGTGDSNYNATLAITDVVNAGAYFTIASNKNVAVNNTGFNQGALYDLLNTIVTNFNALNAKLDAD
jgi:hypothetical protein